MWPYKSPYTVDLDLRYWFMVPYVENVFLLESGAFYPSIHPSSTAQLSWKAVSEEKLRPSSPQAAESYNLSRVSWICLRASSWVDMFKIPLLGCLQKAFDSNTSTTILISLAPLKLESHPALQPIKNIFHSINTGYHY